MTVTCATCANIKRHKQPNEAAEAMYKKRFGFSGCAKQPAYVYFGRMVERECHDYQAKAPA